MFALKSFIVLFAATQSLALPQSLSDFTQSVGNGGNACINMQAWIVSCVNQNRCAAWHTQPQDDWTSWQQKRDLGSPNHDESNEEQLNKKDLSISALSTVPQKRTDERNQIPEWVMCAYADGSYPVVLPKGQIIRAIAAAMELWQTHRQTPPNRNLRQYPQPYTTDNYTPDLRHADGSILMEFPVFPSGAAYAAGEGGSERVIFDRCGEFVTVMSHRLTNTNQLRSCWKVNRDGTPVNGQIGEPEMNGHPIQVANPLQPGAGVPLAWLGLPNNAPYPDPNFW